MTTPIIRPTTKDLAEAAGVSLATVDRVLNDRPNVSSKAREKVNKAIDQIGFVRNLSAVNLVRNKVYSFRFLLPLDGDQYLEKLISEVKETSRSFESNAIFADVFQLPMNDPHEVARYISGLTSNEVDGVAIMAPESPPVRDAMGHLSERGIEVVQFLSGQENLDELDFVGANNFAAGSTAARILGRFSSQQSGKIMCIAETMQSLDSIQRRFGFDDVINDKFPYLKALPSLETYGDHKRAEDIIMRQLEFHKDISGVYIMSSEARIPFEKISKFTDTSALDIVVHERTPFSESALQSEHIDAIIALNTGHAVRSAIRILHARSENRQPLSDQEKLRIEILLKDNL